MAITYGGGTNSIIVTGYSEATPCNVTDLYNADVAGGWGVIIKQSNTQFSFSCKLTIGSDSVETWFEDTAKQILFLDGIATANFSNYMFNAKGYAHITLGKLNDENNKFTSDGCSIYTEDTHYYTKAFCGSSNAVVNLYGCRFYGTAYVGRIFVLIYGRVWNCVFDNNMMMETQSNTTDIYATTSLYTSSAIRIASNVVINKLTGLGVTEGIRFKKNDIIVNEFGAKIRGTNDIVLQNCPSANHWEKLVDADLDKWIFQWLTGADGVVYRQYSFNLKVTDIDSIGISEFNINILDKNGVLVVDTQSDINGVISKQILDFGYYDKLNGSTPTMTTPHTMRIWKYGMLDINSKFEITAKTNWTLTMYEDPYITKNATDAALIGGTCNA